jgi:hypothetical protein
MHYAAPGPLDAERPWFLVGPAAQRASRIAALALLLGACAAMPRAPASSCMQRTMDALDLAGLSDPRKHCVAAGAIRQRCGWLSSMTAGLGKELSDAFGPGDAAFADLEADGAGRECGARSADEALLRACCADAGY